MDAEDFPYDPEFGEPYNSRERFFVERLGKVAGWLHAGRPGREAARIALRIYVRGQLLELVERGRLGSPRATARRRHMSDTLMPDQTYLQQAQPSTFGHYVLSFVYPGSRDARRLLDEFDWVNRSPAAPGASTAPGCWTTARMSRLPWASTRSSSTPATRCGRSTGSSTCSPRAASLLSTQSKLAEDLEIWSSSEFDFVDLADGYTRSSVLMPQKRNPYSLSIVRGASGVLIGRLTGFLAVAKSPSARSDNLIFAYGEVPRALDLAIRVTRLMTGVVRTLTVNAERMAHALDDGYTQATDLSEFIVQTCGVDYRSAYDVVGGAVRKASRRGVPGRTSPGSDARRGSDRRDRGAVGTGRPTSTRPSIPRDRRDPSRDRWCGALSRRGHARAMPERPTTSDRRSSTTSRAGSDEAGTAARAGAPDGRAEEEV